MTNYNSRKSLGTKLRAKRIAPLVEMIETVYGQYGYVNIVDIGGRERYWDIIAMRRLEKHNVSITIVNLSKTAVQEDHGPFRFAVADGCHLADYEDESFHIAHSNSVVEHVGDWERMVSFAKEVSRVAPRYYVQTPNYWFSLEPHCMTPFFHWLPKPLRIWLVLHFQLGHWRKATTTDEAMRTIERCRLLNKRMFKELFKDAHIITETFVGLPKSLIAIRK